jgi:hypothetical protein
MIMFTIYGTPTLIATFAGPKIAELFYTQSNLRWAFGTWSIILIRGSLPVLAILLFHERKAYKAGIVRKRSGRTLLQSAWYYFIHFDGTYKPFALVVYIDILVRFT